MNRLSFTLPLIAVALLATTSLYASFFMRLKASSAETLQNLGGHVISAADAVVNGSEANIKVFGFDGPVAEVIDGLRKAWNLPEIDAGRSFAAEGAWITLEKGDGDDSALIIPGAASGGCSVWLIQAKAAKDASFSATGGNPYPSAVLKSCIQMKGSGTVLTIHETTASPVFALRDVESGMAALGWEPVLQGDTISYFAKDGHAAAAVAYEAHGVTRVSVIRAMGR